MAPRRDACESMSALEPQAEPVAVEAGEQIPYEAKAKEA
jgi:hypothetical protein